MPWPLSQDYNEALQNLQTSFRDPDLRQGQVVVNALGIPQPCSGNFADVYAVECPATGSKWAVKCFTREVHGLRERYSEISSYLQQVRLPFTVDFQYLEQGILIAGRWYPILKMHWVVGFPLNVFVRDMLDKPAMLEKLSRVWVRLARRLREAGMAHCDLQHGNILLVPDNEASSLAVKLIDYDGMWVPALANVPSGEDGHPAYQHPERRRDGVYSVEVDRFPLLAIHVALRALIASGRPLWKRYDTGDNLLFRPTDFEAPAKSPLFAELLRLNHPELRALVVQLIDAARLPLEQTPHLSDLVPEAKSISSVIPRSPAPVASPAPTVAAPATPVVSDGQSPVESPWWNSEATTADPNPVQDIEPVEVTRERQDSLIPWIAAGSVAACAVIGGVVLWGLQPSSNSEKRATEPSLAQGRHETAPQTPEEIPSPAPEEIPSPVPQEKKLPVRVDKSDPPLKVRPEPSDPPPLPVKPAPVPKKKSPLPVQEATKPRDPPPLLPKPKTENKPVKPTETPPAKPVQPPRGGKLPVLDEAVQKKAVEDVRDIYKADYSVMRQSDDRVALAGKLLKRGMNNGEEPARRFAYLSEARDLAARGGDLALCLRAIEETAKTFAVDLLPMKTSAFELAVKTLRSADAEKNLLGLALMALDEAESIDDYEQASKLLKIAQSAALKSGDPYLSSVVSQRKTRLNRLQDKYAKISDAVKTLADKPDDAEGNLAVGKFQCFEKEDWNKGLPMLERGSDSTLAELASKDRANPAEAVVEADLGHKWWHFAENQSETTAKSAAHQRARFWFRKALPRLEGDEKVRVLTRLEKKAGRLRLLPGLVTELFAGENFEKRVKTRLDYKIDYDWGVAAPDPAVPADHFSIRWQGWLVPPRAGKFKLTVSHDDGVRIFLDDNKLIDTWGKVGQESVDVVLSAKPHTLRLEFHDITATAGVHLSWSLEGGFKERMISLDALYHEAKDERLLGL
jgi:serine/threonine protein kinase